MPWTHGTCRRLLDTLRHELTVADRWQARGYATAHVPIRIGFGTLLAKRTAPQSQENQWSRSGVTRSMSQLRIDRDGGAARQSARS